ncbi:MAG: GDP-L-fucose synthase [SAR324 cluster bacterium]|nr:GDP-L-fucose synthase [SAR324 cluster bacterium]
MNKDSRIYIAGHTGLVGSALLRILNQAGYHQIITRTDQELDLTSMGQVQAFFEKEKPEYVFCAAGRVGGIMANKTYPADFIYTNLQIQNNLIHQSYVSGVKRLMYFGSSCIYPKLSEQPIKESYLLTGPLEETNEAYAVAKIAGVKMCESYNRQYGTQFVVAIPNNLYGMNDNFHPENSHVVAALLRRFHEAKKEARDEVVLWGTGTPRREFLYVDDFAKACLFLIDNYEENRPIHLGWGSDISIRELAEVIKEVVGFSGQIEFDSNKPDGMPKKLLDSSRIHQMGWKPETSLQQGLQTTYSWFLKQFNA